MDAELEAYDRLWNTTPKETRNAVAEAAADAYVLAHLDKFTGFRELTLPECVALVGIARANGDEERRILIDVWIMAGFEFQQIGGIYNPLPGQTPPAINVDGVRRQIGG